MTPCTECHEIPPYFERGNFSIRKCDDGDDWMDDSQVNDLHDKMRHKHKSKIDAVTTAMRKINGL